MTKIGASSISHRGKSDRWNKETVMEWDVVDARVIEPGCFHVNSADGMEGRVRFALSANRGVFETMRDPVELNKPYVDVYCVTWPGDLDLAPDAMHAQIKKNGEWLLQ